MRFARCTLALALLAGFAAPTASAKDARLCDEVFEKGSKGPRWDIIQNWITRLKGGEPQVNPNGGPEQWEKRIDEGLALLSDLKTYCDAPATVEKLKSCKDTQGRPRLEGMYYEKDPIVWCMTLPKAKEFMFKDVMGLVEFNEKYNFKVINQPTERQLIQREGWLGQDRLVGWSTMFELNEAYAQEAMRKYMAIFKKLGKTPDNPLSLLAGRKAALKKGAKAALGAAEKANWKLPPKGKSHYGVKLAKAQYTKVFKTARVLKVAAKKGNWTIKKNALGVPLYRDKFGYLLAQVPGEPLCQLRIWYISEQYDGRKYVKDDAVSWGNLRFQKCK